MLSQQATRAASMHDHRSVCKGRGGMRTENCSRTAGCAQQESREQGPGRIWRRPAV